MAARAEAMVKHPIHPCPCPANPDLGSLTRRLAMTKTPVHIASIARDYQNLASGLRMGNSWKFLLWLLVTIHT